MRAMFTKLRGPSDGLTLVEVVLVITLLSILGTVVIYTLGGYYQDNVVTISKITQDTDARSVLYSIGNDLVDSSGFLTSLTVSSPLDQYSNGSTQASQQNGWSYLGLNGVDSPNSRVLIVTRYATDTSPTDPNRQPLFIEKNGSCDPVDTHVLPAQVEFIYYVAKDSQISQQYDLYRRTILPTGSPVYCRGGIEYKDVNGNPGKPWQKQTCAPGTPSSSDPNQLCLGSDAIMLSGITTFNVGYYKSPNDTASNAAPTPISAGSSISVDAAVQLTVGISHMSSGKQVTNGASIRISR